VSARTPAFRALLLPVCRVDGAAPILKFALLGVYLVAVGVQLLDHAMWRDEAQAWLIARASGGPVDLWRNLRFEGHPSLWHVVIWPVARLSSDIALMKGITFLVAGAFGALVALGRTVPPLLRPLLLAGYLPFFGYGVLSRPYLLGLVLLFGWLELFARELQDGRLTLRARMVLVALLSMVHLVFAVVAGALVAGEFLEALRRDRAARRRRVTWSVATGMVVLILTAIFLPDRSGVFVPDAVRFEAVDVGTILRGIAEASGTLPGVPKSGMMVVGAALLGIAVLLAPTRAGLLAIAVAVLTVNRLIGYGPMWWHIGVTTFAIVATGLLALLRARYGTRTRPGLSVAAPAITVLLVPVLVAQVFATVDWFGRDGQLPYSSGREAAAIVADRCPTGCPLVVDTSVGGATVLAYLGAQPAYRLNDSREGTFGIWDPVHGSGEVSWDALADALRERGPDAVGIVAQLREPPPEFVVGRTGPAVWSDEEYLVVVLAAG
jgi:hypothetical protein